MSRARAAVLVTAAAALLALAGCTSSSGDGPGGESGATTASSTPPPSTTSAPPTTSIPPAPTTSAATTTSPPPSTTSAAPATSAPARPVFTTTCRSLSVRVLKGGAIRGAEIAAMQFVNDGTAPCTITGTPTATLLRKGKVVGGSSTPNGDAARDYTIPPGDYAESLLRDFSQCNAPLSDNLRLTLPERNGKRGRTVTEPIALRACTMKVAPADEPS